MFETSRTPLRVSLFGGGSDYPEWYQRHPGAVLGFTIDKYIYISALRLTAFVDYRYRLTYSRLETGNDISDIQHPVVRAVLGKTGFAVPMDYSIQADIPANSGLGSSSAFTVGFVNLISSLQGRSRTKLELSEFAIDIEHNVLNERVGLQDQLHAAFGGLNHFTFEGDQFGINPVRVGGQDLDRLAEWLVLVYTGAKRHASEILRTQIVNTADRKVDIELKAMVDLVGAGHRIFETNRGDDLPVELARLLDETWRLKKRLSSEVSTPDIDDLFDRCRQAGALSGKLCGAGGGGFLLLVVPPDRRSALVDDIGADRCITFRIEHNGSVVSHLW